MPYLDRNLKKLIPSPLIQPIHLLNYFFPQQIKQRCPVFFAQSYFIKTMVVIAQVGLEYLFEVLGCFFNADRAIVQDSRRQHGIKQFGERRLGTRPLKTNRTGGLQVSNGFFQLVNPAKEFGAKGH